MSEDGDKGRYNAHPAYAEGWRDACAGEPLFPDATAEYAAGWRGWHVAKEALESLSLAARDSQASKSGLD